MKDKKITIKGDGFPKYLDNFKNSHKRKVKRILHNANIDPVTFVDYLKAEQKKGDIQLQNLDICGLAYEFVFDEETREEITDLIQSMKEDDKIEATRFLLTEISRRRRGES